MPDNFWLKGLAKFRQMAILAIFGGYFWRGHSNEACDTIFSLKIWPPATFVNALWLNSFNWRFGDFWWLLLAWFKGSLWYQFSIDYLTLYNFLQVKSEDYSSFYTDTFLLKNRVVSTKSNFNFLKSTYSLKKQVVRTTIRYINFSNFGYLQSAYFLYKPLDSLTEIQIYRIGK